MVDGADSRWAVDAAARAGPGDGDDDNGPPIGDPDDGDYDDEDDEDDDEEPLWVGSLYCNRRIALQHSDRISGIIKILRRTLHSI
jgi:hypothetical protein